LVKSLLSGLAGDAEAAGDGGPGAAVGAGSGKRCGELLVGFSAAACPACGVFSTRVAQGVRNHVERLIDGDPTHQILSAWIAKEELRVLLDQLAGLFAGWGVMTNVVPDSPAHLPGPPPRPWMSWKGSRVRSRRGGTAGGMLSEARVNPTRENGCSGGSGSTGWVRGADSPAPAPAPASAGRGRRTVRWAWPGSP